MEAEETKIFRNQNKKARRPFVVVSVQHQLD